MSGITTKEVYDLVEITVSLILRNSEFGQQNRMFLNSTNGENYPFTFQKSK